MTGGCRQSDGWPASVRPGDDVAKCHRFAPIDPASSPCLFGQLANQVGIVLVAAPLGNQPNEVAAAERFDRSEKRHDSQKLHEVIAERQSVQVAGRRQIREAILGVVSTARFPGPHRRARG
jgi:hypothetical protein